MMSGFSRRLYALVRQIPPGQVATYGQLALLLGNPRMFGGDLLHHGGHHAAGAAPGGPEVQEYGNGRREHFLVEVLLGNG